MKLLLPAGFTLLVLIAVAETIRYVAYEPYRCELLTQRLQIATTRLSGVNDDHTLQLQTRTNIEQLNRCVTTTPWLVNTYMVLAANYAIRGERHSARDVYLRALHIDRRPEIYFSLAEQLALLGDEEGAFKNYVTACVVNPHWSDQLSQPMRSRVYNQVNTLRAPKEAG